MNSSEFDDLIQAACVDSTIKNFNEIIKLICENKMNGNVFRSVR